MSVPEIRIVERVEPDKSKHHLFTQAAVEIEVFPDDVIKSIEQIDKLPVGKWTEFAIQNDLPCEPLDRKLLKGPLMGIIQLAWHQHFKGTVSERLLANQERRVATYREDLEHVKLSAATPEQRQQRARQTGSAVSPRIPAIGLRYRLKDETMVTWSQYRSQKGLIVSVMIAAGATETGGKVITKDQVVAALRGKLNTRQPEERVVGFYMSEWKKNNIVEQVDDPAAVKGEIPEGFVATETPAPAAAPATPAAEPAAEGKEPAKQASAKKAKSAKQTPKSK